MNAPTWEDGCIVGLHDIIKLFVRREINFAVVEFAEVYICVQMQIFIGLINVMKHRKMYLGVLMKPILFTIIMY